LVDRRKTSAEHRRGAVVWIGLSALPAAREVKLPAARPRRAPRLQTRLGALRDGRLWEAVLRQWVRPGWLEVQVLQVRPAQPDGFRRESGAY
jgi:hypothetical protein